MRRVLVVTGSYFIGSIPVAYLTGRLLRGVDIRERGSGNVGASNIWQSVSRVAVVPVGLAEIAQGLAGPALAQKAASGHATRAVAGVAAVVGHNWSPFLRFTGGRGVGHAIGVMLAISRPALAAFIVISLIGVKLRAVPQFVGLAILAMPFVAGLARQHRETVTGLGCVTALIFAKRLLGNGPPTSKEGRWRVLLNRLLYDRDTSDRDRWVSQGIEASG